MYEQVFGFTSRPFSATPFVQTYFPAEAIHYALSQSRLCIERASGPVVVTGPSGTGKTLLMTMLSEQYASDFSIVNIVCSNLVERKDLLQHILFELNLPYREMSEGELRLSLIDFLKKSDDSPSIRSMGVLVLVDEAHTLSAELLDELRGITNFVRAGRPAISLVMAGSPSLEGNLIDTKSESFNQRIAARCFLSNLGEKETYEYVLTQVERAGGNAETLFTADALSRVYEASDGCPRLINQVCDYSLVLAASENSSRVTNTIVMDAWNDVQSIPSPSSTTAPVFEGCAESGSEFAGENLSSGDLVLEFGSLDDEPSNSTANNYSAQTSEPVDSAAVDELDFLSDTQNGIDEYRLQDEGTETPVAHVNALPVVDQYDYSIVSSSDDVPDETMACEVAPDFSDPFAESFEAEEAVDPSYVPFISAQNINSLMVTTEQLAMLETLAEHESEFGKPIEYNVETVAESSAEHSFAVIPKEDVEEDDETVDSQEDSEDLAISAEGLASLDQIQEDIRRLQMDLQFSKQNFASEAVHPDFAVVSAEQPIEELLPEHPVAVETNSMDVAETTPIVVEAANIKTEAIASQDVEIVAESGDSGAAGYSIEVSLAEAGVEYDDDDRDMMILSQPEKFQTRDEADEDVELAADVRISTGKACRVDYHDLFRQLRSAN